MLLKKIHISLNSVNIYRYIYAVKDTATGIGFRKLVLEIINYRVN